VISIQSYESLGKERNRRADKISISFTLFRWSLVVVVVIESTSKAVRQYTQLLVDVMLAPGEDM
jgi:hypothetical protein